MNNQTNHNALLTLAIPVTLEEDVLDFLLQHPRWAAGFSVIDAKGVGQGTVLLSSMEQVQGRGRRKLVMIAGNDAQLRLLIQALAREICNPHVAYWISPITSYGRLV